MTMSTELAQQVADLLNAQNQLTVPYTVARVLRDDGYVTKVNDAGKVIGVVEVKKVQWYQCEISHVSVDPGSQRQGVASALLRAAEERAKVLGARVAQCTIRVGNSASERLFERFGYLAASTFQNEASGNKVTVYQKVL